MIYKYLYITYIEMLTNVLKILIKKAKKKNYWYTSKCIFLWFLNTLSYDLKKKLTSMLKVLVSMT